MSKSFKRGFAIKVNQIVLAEGGEGRSMIDESVSLSGKEGYIRLVTLLLVILIKVFIIYCCCLICCLTYV